MAELTRSDKILAEKTVCVLLVRGEDPQGEPIYAYVGIRADKLNEFIAAQAKGLFYPEEHGIVVESGFGEPSDEVKARMERDYGFNHGAMTDIPDAEQATKVTSELARSVREQQQKKHDEE